MNTTSQYIVLTLQTADLLYSIRVRGGDSTGRGEWSELYIYASGEQNALITTIFVNIITSSATLSSTAILGSVNGNDAYNIIL